MLGEGSACLILESAEHAKARNAPIYCELSSAVSLNDAHYVLRPDKEGQVTTMKTCIEQSGLSPQDIDYVSLHATGN